VDNKLISPNGDNILEQATFSLKITDSHYLEWKLSVMDDVGKSVKIFTGKGKNPQKKLVWDGKDDNKKDVIDGNCQTAMG
jgi:flagellar hook assembly protein FlgD